MEPNEFGPLNLTRTINSATTNIKTNPQPSSKPTSPTKSITSGHTSDSDSSSTPRTLSPASRPASPRPPLQREPSKPNKGKAAPPQLSMTLWWARALIGRMFSVCVSDDGAFGAKVGSMG